MHPNKEKYKKTQFVESWKYDGYVDQITKDHCLIFNKFAECDKHVLVITKKQENQTSALNMTDFKAALLVMKSLDCFGFFNCGFDSGGSMNHKHIQFMPYSSVAASGQSGMIPLEKTAMYYYEKAGIKDQMFTLPQFSGFKHVFLKYEYDMLNF